MDDYQAPEIVCAALSGDNAEVQRLLEQGHNVNAINELTWDSPLLHALYKNNIELVKMLLEWGANPHQGGYGESTLHIAVRVGNLEIVKLLVEDHHVDLHEKDGCGYSPLHIAITGDNVGTVKYLLSKGADPNDTVGDDSPDSEWEHSLHLLRTDNVEMAKTLVEGGANVDRRNSDRVTPLMWACSVRHVGVALYLISAGANVSYRCRHGLTALHEARRNKLTVVIDKLCG